MSLLTVKICKWRSCTERFSGFIEKRLIGDCDFYTYNNDVEIESCLCQGRCKEWPTVVFGNDIQSGMNPIKASEVLRRKIQEARKKLQKM